MDNELYEDLKLMDECGKTINRCDNELRVLDLSDDKVKELKRERWYAKAIRDDIAEKEVYMDVPNILQSMSVQLSVPIDDFEVSFHSKVKEGSFGGGDIRSALHYGLLNTVYLVSISRKSNRDEVYEYVGDLTPWARMSTGQKLEDLLVIDEDLNEDGERVYSFDITDKKYELLRLYRTVNSLYELLLISPVFTSKYAAVCRKSLLDAAQSISTENLPNSNLSM